ncbi:MAG TPA: hypothetical protein VMS77_06155 [Conexivisphaerales archaeon]|nr:hypothetical protein [Conexivisphaerales archaeon]
MSERDSVIRHKLELLRLLEKAGGEIPADRLADVSRDIFVCDDTRYQTVGRLVNGDLVKEKVGPRRYCLTDLGRAELAKAAVARENGRGEGRKAGTVKVEVELLGGISCEVPYEVEFGQMEGSWLEDYVRSKAFVSDLKYLVASVLYDTVGRSPAFDPYKLSASSDDVFGLAVQRALDFHLSVKLDISGAELRTGLKKDQLTRLRSQLRKWERVKGPEDRLRSLRGLAAGALMKLSVRGKVITLASVREVINEELPLIETEKPMQSRHTAGEDELRVILDGLAKEFSFPVVIPVESTFGVTKGEKVYFVDMDARERLGKWIWSQLEPKS